MGYNLGDILFQLIVFSLIIIGVVSFTLFIRRLIINSKVQSHSAVDLNKKLDRIIELLEKKNS
ncbi:hypothetical protein A6P54_08630 [Bacillus sp. MKU004]|nr:hypothetical protein A6P54_08630 [Bacillus sp. MKU004]QTC42648.1 DUF4083 domain-containing protein [Bacillus sp. V3]